MALTEKDKELLPADDQKKIDFLTKVYDNASKRGDTKTMDDAASQASTIRNNAGYKSDSSGNYVGSISPAVTTGSGTSGGNSQYSNGNYKIGSEAGINQAQNMAIDGTYTASDGSVWTKNKDGTITVNHNGVITQNAYTPTDLSILLKQQMAAGLPYQDVQNTLNARVEKATGDPALGQYAYDNVYDMAWDYIQNAKAAETKQNEITKSDNWLKSYTASNPTPTYKGTDPRIEEQLNAILNREDFSYDVATDPMYEQYARMYQREGDRAMRDTLAEVASGAGGMNSYAVTAAQQAANYYSSQLGDKIPELYQLAYEMYLTDIDNQVRDLGLLQQMDDSQYNRYRDTMSDWKDDRKFAYGAYQDAITQGNWQTQFDYNADVNNRDFAYNDYWANKKWNESQEDKDLENSRYDTESAKAEVEWYVSMGVMPDAKIIEAAKMDYNTIAQAVEQQKASNAPKYTGNGGGNNSIDEDAKKEAINTVKWAVADGVMPDAQTIELSGIPYDTVVSMVVANGGEPPADDVPDEEPQLDNTQIDNEELYYELDGILSELFKTQGFMGVSQALTEARATMPELGEGTYLALWNKYSRMDYPTK